MLKTISIALIFLGEGLAIYSEMVVAKNMAFFSNVFLKMFGLMTLAGFFLIAGYVLGLKSFQNIWILGAVSIASIIILEPLITYAFFNEFPSRGPLIGLILGVSGLLFALLVK